MDRRVPPYLVLGIFCGPLPLIVYFGTTRKSALGWLMGVGVVILVYAMTVVAATVATLVVGTVR
jgi:hypothetical protein